MSVQEEKRNTPALILGVLLIFALVVVALVVLASKGKGGDGSTEPDLPPIDIPTPPPDAPTVTANIAINVRTGPSTQYASYGVAQEGSKGEAIGVSEDGT